MKWLAIYRIASTISTETRNGFLIRMKSLTALPIYNEAKHLCEVITEVKKHSSEILVIDDGSTDSTSEVLGRIEGITVVTHEKNQGYGAALRTTFCYAIQNGYECLVTIDCDGQHEPCLIPKLVQRMEDCPDKPDIVSGSRYLKKFDDGSTPPEDRRQINMEITELLNSEYNLKITDAFCGFKAYRVETLKRLCITEPGYAMPLQLWTQVAHLGLKVVEHPVPLIYLDEDRSFGGTLDDSEHRRAYYQEVLQREREANLQRDRQKIPCGSS